MLASHLTFGAYGFWLPNDPRGSWSDYVRQRKLLEFGKASKVETKDSVAHLPHDVALRYNTKKALQFPPVAFDGIQARAVGNGFAIAVKESAYLVFACAILPTHVHLVVAVHTNPPRRIIGHFKARATQSLNREGIHPLENQASPWSVKGWAVFLDTDDEVFRAIEYVNKNPIKEGLPPQRWKFVVPYVP